MSISIPISAKLARFCRVVAALFLFCASETSAAAPDFLGPDAIVASKDGKTLYVTCRDSSELLAVDVAGRKVIGKIALPAEPTGMALTPEGDKLYVTCTGGRDTVCVVETASCKIAGTMPVGITAIGPAITPDGRRLYVCNQFENKVTAIDLGSGREITSVLVPREPCSAAVTPDGKSVFAADLLPHDPADAADVAAVIAAIDTTTNQATIIRLPNGSIDVRGLCVSPDGKYVYAVHILAQYQLPTTLVDRGWVNTNAMSVIDARTKKLINTVLLDDVFRGAANPWSVTATADGKLICVTHAGTHELSVIDAQGLIEKLTKLGNIPLGPATDTASTNAETMFSPAANVRNDLGFLGNLRRRVQLEGNGPHGVAIIGSIAYIAEYFSDTVAVVDLRSNPPRLAGRIMLGPKPTITTRRRGEMLFNDATICFQHWQSSRVAIPTRGRTACTGICQTTGWAIRRKPARWSGPSSAAPPCRWVCGSRRRRPFAPASASSCSPSDRKRKPWRSMNTFVR